MMTPEQLDMVAEILRQRGYGQEEADRLTVLLGDTWEVDGEMVVTTKPGGNWRGSGSPHWKGEAGFEAKLSHRLPVVRTFLGLICNGLRRTTRQ